MSRPAAGPGDEQVPARRRPPEHLLVATVAAAAGIGDTILVVRAGHSIGSAVAAGLAMAAFVYTGLRWSRWAQRRFRTAVAGRPARATRAPGAPAEPAASAGLRPPAAGGWANPTRSQRLTARLARAFRWPGTGRRRPTGPTGKDLTARRGHRRGDG